MLDEFSKNDFENNLAIGKLIFEDVPNNLKPFWSGLILSCFNDFVKYIPDSIGELNLIIDHENKWVEARVQFIKIRQFLLDHKDYRPEAYLSLAEKVAKITYNACGEPAQFDADSGWYITSLAMKTAAYYKNDRLNAEIRAIILLFINNKKFKDNIHAAKQFLIYRKIDEILWYDWDPIGVNDITDARNEYRGYVSEIVELKQNGMCKQEIALHLFEIETERMGLSGVMANCLITADRIISLSY